MGDIIQAFRVRAGARGEGRPLRLYFDTGSPYTFIKESVAKKLGKVSTLSTPHQFGGLGNGRFHSRAMLDMFVKLLGVWCAHPTYVVPDEILEVDYDVLVGHDLMQRFNIRPLPREQRVALDSVAIHLSQRVR